MTRPHAASLLALALAVACSDSPTGPQLTASVEILANNTPLDERTIRIEETVQLSAFPRDAAGRELGGRATRWTSTAPSIATVDSSGLVRGLDAGTSLIIATSDTASDTARINVAAPISSPIACSQGKDAISLAVGQVYATTAWEQSTLCLDGGVGGAEFLLVPFHASRSAGGVTLPVELAAHNLMPAIASTSIQAAATAELDQDRFSAVDETFHWHLRERALPSLNRRMRELRERDGVAASRALLAAAVPKPGEQMRLNVQIGSSDGCADPVYRTGRVVAVTERAVVIADSANPAGGFTDDEYLAFGTAFDQLVYPLGVESFGAPSDIDKNGRALIFFTSAVNNLTTAGSGYYVGGFVYDRDLFPREGSGGCAGSNAAEMFYLMVPDRSRQVLEPAFEKERVRSGTLGVVAHEFQHLINASRRLYVNRAPVWEVTWLNEGLSHIAEELLFHRVSGLAPRMNEDGTRLTSESARRALIDYQLSNIERYVQFLRSPHTASATGADVLATRGAIWNFLRFAADRYGGSQHTLWNRLVNSRTSGFANLNEALGADALPWMNDWILSVYLDDAGLQTSKRFDQPSWNFRALLPRLGGLARDSNLGRFPLRTLGFQDHRLTLDLPGGSAGYVHFGVAERQQAAIRITSGGLPGPAKLKVTVIRTR